jgi:hypothetical protein
LAALLAAVERGRWSAASNLSVSFSHIARFGALTCDLAGLTIIGLLDLTRNAAHWLLRP